MASSQGYPMRDGLPESTESARNRPVTSDDCLISGKRCFLTPFRLPCINEEYIGWLNDPELMFYSRQRGMRHDFETCIAYFETFANSGNLFLAAHEADSGGVIGTMTAYFNDDGGTADIGILVGKRGRGYGVEIWQLIMDHLFLDRGVNRVTGGAPQSHEAMIGIFHATGMTRFKIRPCDIGHLLDAEIWSYGIDRETWSRMRRDARA